MRNFNYNFFDEIIKVLKKFNAYGDTWLAGGAVRDYFLDVYTEDFDFATVLSPEEISNISIPGYVGPDRKGDLGSYTYKNECITIDVTSLRSEIYLPKSRRPYKLAFVKKLDIDVLRRDYTINTLYMDRRGFLIDYLDGFEDLKSKILRCVGDADEKFLEDPLRILRGLRFVCKYGFKFEHVTKRAFVKNFKLIYELSPERRFGEFKKIVEIDGWRFLLNLKELGLDIIHINFLNKELSLRLIGYDYFSLEILDFTLQSVDSWDKVAGIFESLADLTGNIWKEFREQQYILDLLEDSHDISGNFIDFSFSSYEDKFLFSLAEVLYKYNFKYSYNENTHQIDKFIKILHNIKSKNLPRRVCEMNVKGQDFKERGFHGKAIGEGLDSLFTEVLLGVRKDREFLLELISDLPIKGEEK